MYLYVIYCITTHWHESKSEYKIYSLKWNLLLAVPAPQPWQKQYNFCFNFHYLLFFPEINNLKPEAFPTSNDPLLPFLYHYNFM